MEHNRTISALSAAVILITAVFVGVVTLGLTLTVSKLAGMIFLGAGLLCMAYMLEMVLPSAVFMRMVMFVSGLGFAATSLMNALFPQVVIQAMMGGLMALSMFQIMVEQDSSPDG